MGVVINGCAHSVCRNITLAVLHKECNEINLKLLLNDWTPVLQRVLQNHGFLLVQWSVCPLIRQFSIFLRNDTLIFSSFWHYGR